MLFLHQEGKAPERHSLHLNFTAVPEADPDTETRALVFPDATPALIVYALFGFKL